MKVYKPVSGAGHATYENTRPLFVAEDLSTLCGASSGTVVLPLRLDWSRSNSYDLANPVQVRTMYATVLREVCSEADLDSYLSRTLLIREWANLRLPPFLRDTWESKHPVLRSRFRPSGPERRPHTPPA